jgi:transmembrane 9 superfamily protein 2/4
MTYEVEWTLSETRWASRWDTYLAMTDVQIHWFSIVNSVIVVFFLAGILSMIIVKTLRRDIARYNQEDSVSLEIKIWIKRFYFVFRMMLQKKLDGNCMVF